MRTSVQNLLPRAFPRICACFLLLVSLAVAADVRSTTYRLDIPAQALSDALQSLALVSQHRLFYDAALVKGKNSVGLKGEFTTQQAIERLLAGTGLRYEITDEGLVLILPPAASPSAAAHDDELVEEVIVTAYDFRPLVTASATKMPLSVHDTPQVVNIYNADVLEQLNVKDIGDLATYAPGLGAAGNYNGTGDDRLFLRGFELQETGLKRDGYRVSNAAALDISLIDSIEIIKGPSSILDGYGSPGGVVNYRTKRPKPDSQYTAEVEVGSYGLRRVDVDLNYAAEIAPFSLRIAGATETADSFMEIAHEQRMAASVSARYELGADTSLELQGLFQRMKAKPNSGWAATGGIRFPYEIPRSTYPGQPWNRSERQNQELNVTVSHRFSDDLALKGFVSWGTDKTDALWTATYSNGSWRPGQSLNAYAIGNKEQFPQRRAELVLTGAYTVFGRRSTFAASADYFRQKSTGETLEPYFDLPLFDPLHPDYSVPQPTLQKSPTAVRTQRESAGIGLQTVVYLSDDWWVLVGGRYDTLKTTESRYDTYATVPRKENRWLPRFGLVHRIKDRLNAYYSYSESYVPVTAFDRNYNALPPETSNQHELGLKALLFGGDLQIQAAAFKITRNDVAVAVFDPDAVNHYPSDIIGQQRHSGFELTVVGRITPRWNLYAGYSWLDTKIERGDFERRDVSGNQAPMAAPQTASLFSVYEFDRGLLQGWGAGGGIAYVDRQFVTSENLARLDSYVRVDANVFYRPTPRTQISLSVTNLLDETITTTQAETAIQGFVYADVREWRLTFGMKY